MDHSPGFHSEMAASSCGNKQPSCNPCTQRWTPEVKGSGQVEGGSHPSLISLWYSWSSWQVNDHEVLDTNRRRSFQKSPSTFLLFVMRLPKREKKLGFIILCYSIANQNKELSWYFQAFTDLSGILKNVSHGLNEGKFADMKLRINWYSNTIRTKEHCMQQMSVFYA